MLSLVLGSPVLVALAELFGTVGILAQRWHWSSRGVPGVTAPYNYSHLLPMAQREPHAQGLP